MYHNTLKFILLILVFTSCQGIDKDDITIIDGVQLGMDEDAFNSQLDSLEINQDVFYTKVLFDNLDEVDDTRVRFNFTDIFNNNKYNSSVSKTYGLYYPTNWAGTKNIIGLTVLLVHSDNALLFSNTGFGNITKEKKISGISQNIPDEQSEDIARMLSEKYGPPMDTLKSDLTTFFVFQGKQIGKFHSDNSNLGELLIWKTKCIDIRYFKGIESSETFFNKNLKGYFTILDKSSSIDYDNGERMCRSYGYIMYQLNDETIKKMKLDKRKL